MEKEDGINTNEIFEAGEDIKVGNYVTLRYLLKDNIMEIEISHPDEKKVKVTANDWNELVRIARLFYMNKKIERKFLYTVKVKISLSDKKLREAISDSMVEDAEYFKSDIGLHEDKIKVAVVMGSVYLMGPVFRLLVTAVLKLRGSSKAAFFSEREPAIDWLSKDTDYLPYKVKNREQRQEEKKYKTVYMTALTHLPNNISLFEYEDTKAFMNIINLACREIMQDPEASQSVKHYVDKVLTIGKKADMANRMKNEIRRMKQEGKLTKQNLINKKSSSFGRT